MKELEQCTLCPRNCKVNRYQESGYCMAPAELVVARASIHQYEEPPLSKKNGSGTIFFSYCNLKCIFCQNYQISEEHIGQTITTDKFKEICLNLQKQGANNINLVTPTHFTPLIKEGLIKAKQAGLTIPIVYNTSSYDSVNSLKTLEGLIDIYLPDLKYYDNTLGEKYSNCQNYFHYASLAIQEMYRQVGKPKFNEKGIMQKGLIVRHLLLPGHLEDSKKIIEYLYQTYQDNIYISIMNQYTPIRKLKYENLNKKVSKNDYDKLIDYACDLGITNAFIQIGNTQKKSFIPDFKNQKI